MSSDLLAHLAVHGFVLFLGAYCALLGFDLIKPTTHRGQQRRPLLRIVGIVLSIHAIISTIRGWPS